MRLLYNEETIEQELNAAIGNKKLSNWFWVYFLHPGTTLPSLKITTAFFFHNRKHFRKLYTDNDNLFGIIKESLADCIIPKDSFCYAPYISPKKVHPKVYFFGDKKKISECKKWIAFIGSYNVQFNQWNGCIRVAATIYFETMAKLTSDEDPELLDELAEYFGDLENEINLTRRKDKRMRKLPEPEDYRNYIEKHNEKVIESLNQGKYSEHRLRDWQLFKDKYQPTKVVTNTVLSDRYGLSRERVRQIIERMKRILITNRFTFLESEG